MFYNLCSPHLYIQRNGGKIKEDSVNVDARV